MNFNDFRTKLATVIAHVKQMGIIDKDPSIHSIIRQLQYVDQWTQEGKRPTQSDLDRLSFGAMASRTIHDTNPELAKDIYELSNFLIYWPINKNY